MDVQALILKKLDDLDSAGKERAEQLADIRETLARQAAVLEDHTRRSLANEANLELLRAEFAPVKSHVAVVGAIAKGSGAAVGLVGTILGILRTLGKL